MILKGFFFLLNVVNLFGFIDKNLLDFRVIIFNNFFKFVLVLFNWYENVLFRQKKFIFGFKISFRIVEYTFDILINWFDLILSLIVLFYLAQIFMIFITIENEQIF